MDCAAHPYSSRTPLAPHLPLCRVKKEKPRINYSAHPGTRHAARSPTMGNGARPQQASIGAGPSCAPAICQMLALAWPRSEQGYPETGPC